MDGLASREHVIVIGGHQHPGHARPGAAPAGPLRPRDLDPRSPTSTAARRSCEIHSRGMPLAADVDLEQLAAITHGFVGADLAALCREAAMICLRRLCPRSISRRDTSPTSCWRSSKSRWTTSWRRSRSRALGHPRGVRRGARCQLGRRRRAAEVKQLIRETGRVAAEVRRPVSLVPAAARRRAAAFRPARLREDAARQGGGGARAGSTSSRSRGRR